MIATREKITSVKQLLERSLDDQQDLSAVERFSHCHANGDLPEQARYYRDLLPAEPPGPGQQYAFEVDLDRCTGCKACVTACHNLNGLDQKETWRFTGSLVGGTVAQPFQQTVTTACHHCLEPACMHGCPVKAYEKDPDTGIVKHLDDQCIGCKYCTLTCPYDVPQFSKAKGIVRKCDMCTDRLAVGEAPACVQACPSQAIRIRTVSRTEVLDQAEADRFLPGAPAPDKTMPTTTYKSSKPFPNNILPADHHEVKPEAAHLPLVVMLVLTQLSVGAFLFSLFVDAPVFSAMGALGVGVLALGASTLHLGRPQFAFRAILGLKTSWLSREVLTFGLFTGAATTYVASLFVMPALANAVLGGAVTFGLAGVFSSIMLYSVTPRPTWQFPITAFKFFGTTVLLGLAFLSLFTAVPGILIAGLVLAKLLYEASDLLHRNNPLQTPRKKVAQLVMGSLRRPFLLRIITGLLGAALVVFPGVSFALLLASELCERLLYFRTGVTTRMPGESAR